MEAGILKVCFRRKNFRFPEWLNGSGLSTFLLPLASWFGTELQRCNLQGVCGTFLLPLTLTRADAATPMYQPWAIRWFWYGLWTYHWLNVFKRGEGQQSCGQGRRTLGWYCQGGKIHSDLHKHRHSGIKHCTASWQGVFVGLSVFCLCETVCVCMCVFKAWHVCVCACIYPCMDAHSAHAGALVHTHKHIPTHTYTHTQIETHIHDNTYSLTYQGTLLFFLCQFYTLFESTVFYWKLIGGILWIFCFLRWLFTKPENPYSPPARGK